MIDLPFDPEIHLGPFSLAWHGVFTAVGIFLGVWIAIRLLRGRVPEDAAYSVAWWGVVGGITGARILHVADRWAYYSEHLEQIPMIWTGGIAVWGAAIGGVIAGLIVALRRGDVPIGAGADAGAAGIGLGFGVGRIGDIINGEHHAVACDGALRAQGPLPLGVCVGYSNPATLGQPGPVHLVVAYDMIWDLLGVGFALLLRRRLAAVAPEGRIFWLWMIWYAMGRFLLGFLRIGDPTSIAGLRQDQLVAVAVFLVSVPALALLQAGVLTRATARFRRATAA